MTTAGILRPDEVIFYHPLDNFVEATLGQTWTGSGGFVAGKIGLGNSAVAGDSVSWGPVTTAPTAMNSSGPMVKMDSSRFVVSYLNGTLPSVRVITVSGNAFTFGPGFTLSALAVGRPPAIALFSSTVIGLMWQRGMVVGIVSGTDITFGAQILPPLSAGNADPSGDFVALSSTVAVLTWSINFPSNSAGNFATVVTISGTDISFGAITELVLTSKKGSGVVKLDSTTVLASWNTDTGIDTATLTVSGTTVTKNATVVLSTPAGVAKKHDILLLSAGKVAYVWNPGNGLPTAARIATVSGTDITFGAEKAIQLNLGGAGAVALTSSTFVTITGSSSRQAFLCTVSGLDITVGPSSTTTGAGVGRAVKIDDTSFISGTGPDFAVGTIGQESSMVAATPGAYPAAAGADRLVVAMWGNKVGAGASVVTIQRDFTVLLDATSISLGPATAVWSSAAVGTLMGTTMAGGEHLLILDFVNTGGGNWTLSTSLDGQAFVSQGAQTSGTRTTSPATLTPGISIVDGAATQWLDETVMWAGNQATFTQFTTQELANLNDLADIFDEPMNQFEENFGAPICWQATAKMSDGSVWRDSGSGPCPPVIRVPKGANDIVVTDDGNRASPRVIEG